MDCSPPGSPVHGIFQARVLEWVAIAFSEITLNYTKIKDFFSWEDTIMGMKRSHIPEMGEDLYKTTKIELVSGIYRELL